MKSDELIREVEEELQREKLAKLWRRFAPLVIGAALLLVAGTAGWVGWQHWQERRLEQQATALAEARRQLAATDAAGAAATFAALADDATAGFGAVARLGEARARLAAGDREGAIDALDLLAADPRADPLLRDLAKLHAVALRIDTAPPAALEAELAPLAAAGAPWRHRARELQALAMLRDGREAEAGRLLDELAADGETPPALRARAAELRASIAVPVAGS